MFRQFQADRKATFTRITTMYYSQNNMSNHEADLLQKQIMSSSTSVTQEQKAEAKVGTGSSKLDI